MTASQQPDAEHAPRTSPAAGGPGSTGHDKAVEWMGEWLIQEGCGVGDGFHGWRCEYPDIYGPCDCVAESARDLLSALRAALAAGDADVAEALGLRADTGDDGHRPHRFPESAIGEEVISWKCAAIEIMSLGGE